MRHDEFLVIIDDAIRKFWPSWKPPEGKVGWCAAELRYANREAVWRTIDTYAHENPDEDRPKALWSRLMFLASECSGDGQDRGIDQFGMTPGEKTNIVRGLRERARRGGCSLPADDEAVYLDWSRRTHPRMFGAPFIGSIDWALVIPENALAAIYESGGARAAAIKIRRDWYKHGPRTPVTVKDQDAVERAAIEYVEAQAEGLFKTDSFF